MSYVHLPGSGGEPSAPLNSSLQERTKPLEGGTGEGVITPPPAQFNGNDSRQASRNTGKDFGLGKVQRALERTFFAINFFLQLHNRVEKRFGPWGAARNVNIDGDHLITALHDRVIIKHSAGSSTSTHGNDPFGLGHLVVKLSNHRRHLLRKSSRHNHQVRLPGRRTKHFRTESRHVKTRSRHRHHLDRAASQTKTERPNRTPPRPVH